MNTVTTKSSLLPQSGWVPPSHALLWVTVLHSASARQAEPSMSQNIQPGQCRVAAATGTCLLMLASFSWSSETVN